MISSKMWSRVPQDVFNHLAQYSHTKTLVMMTRINKEMKSKLADENLWNQKFKDVVEPHAHEFIGSNKEDRKKFLYDIEKSRCSNTLPPLHTDEHLPDFLSVNQFKFLFVVKEKSMVVHQHESEFDPQETIGFFNPIDKPSVFDEMFHNYAVDDTHELIVYVKRKDHKNETMFALLDFDSIGYHGATGVFENMQFIQWGIPISNLPKCESFELSEDVHGFPWPLVNFTWSFCPLDQSNTMNQSVSIELRQGEYVDESEFLKYFTTFFELSSK
jgi:hypothetical protein